MKITQDGWLEADVAGDPKIVRYPSVRTSSLIVPEPIAIVWHYTATNGGPGLAESLAKRIQTYKQGVDRTAGWHLIVAKEDGAIYQSVPFTKGAWHVAPAGVIAGVKGSVNRRTIGVELENAGQLKKLGDKFYCWPYYKKPAAPPPPVRPPAERDPRFNRDLAITPPHDHEPDPRCEVALEHVCVGDHGAWAAYTKPQAESAEKLLRALVERFHWDRQCSSYGHVSFDPERKVDPGPVWSKRELPKILDAVFGVPA